MIHIVLIDTQELERVAFKEVLQALEIPLTVSTFISGESALRFLQSEYSSPSKTELAVTVVVFTEIELLEIDGFEVINGIKTNPNLRDIPIILYSKFLKKKQIEKAYLLGANFCMEKLEDQSEMLENTSGIFDFLQKAGKLPM